MKTMLYLAMTAQELTLFSNPALSAYMACHFSPYDPGLTNLPESITADSMVILNDRIPFLHHDCRLIASQLASLPCESLLLDLQNTEPEQAKELITSVLSVVSVPVAVSEQYAVDCPCAVFLSTVDADRDPLASLNAWSGRDIWLDMSPGCVCYRIDSHGSRRTREKIFPDSPIHADPNLPCHYGITLTEAEAIFYIYRTWEDIARIMDQGKKMGISRCIGLHQEWQRFIPDSGNK